MRIAIGLIVVGVAASGCGTKKSAPTAPTHPVTATTAPSPAGSLRATLQAPTHMPKAGAKWYYTVGVHGAGGRPLHARLTVEIVDPLGAAHPVQFGTTTRNLVDWPVVGTFRDFVVWPASSRGFQLALRATVKANGARRKRELFGPRAVTERRGGVEVVVDRVRKSFDAGRIRAVDDVSLRLAAGEFVALIGPSGCGKSTLLNLIGALDRPDAGTISVDGQSLAPLRDPAGYRARTVGFVFQSHNLIPVLSALENVQVPMIGRGLPRSERERRAQELLVEAGLAHRAGGASPTLSGGERQRVAIARALANRPQLLLADEPTGALDSETGGQILELLHRLRERHGMTILLVTNDLVVAERADRLLRMRDGRLEDGHR